MMKKLRRQIPGSMVEFQMIFKAKPGDQERKKSIPIKTEEAATNLR